MKKNSRQNYLKRRFAAYLWSLICTATVSLFYLLSSSFATEPQPSVDLPTELYSTQIQNDLRTAFLQAIKEAEKSIYLSIYSLTDRTIIDALKKKSEENIPVTIVYDAVASEGVHQQLGNKIKSTARKSKGLMHQKILVVDDAKCWIGSANFTPTSLRSHGNLVCGFYSKELACALKRKALSLSCEGRLEAIPQQNFIIDGQNVELWFLPDCQEAIPRITSLIRSAKKTIKVAMFTWTRHDLANELINAEKRGVNVQVVMDKNSSQGVSAAIAEKLHRNGINVRTGQGNSLLHHKFMIVDNKTLVNGSANWTKAAFTQNDDCFIVLNNLNSKQKKQLQTLWKITQIESQELRD